MRQFLDDVVPLVTGSHRDATAYRVEGGRLAVDLPSGGDDHRRRAGRVRRSRQRRPTALSLLLEHHGLGIELVIDAEHPVGRDDVADVADVRLEAAVTAIMDCEDSVAAVDGADKALAYHNWLGLMQGALTEPVDEGRHDVHPDARARPRVHRSGRRRPSSARDASLMLVRNVGHLMTTPAVLDGSGAEVPEGLLDAVVTVLCALHDLRKAPTRRCGTPGRARCTWSSRRCTAPPRSPSPTRPSARSSDCSASPPNTVKIGIMDEERRTTVNLGECIRAARHRLAFINTGFLDRTGDEIHTSMQAGPVVRKNDMRRETWIRAYEDWNVDVGLACGLSGRAQIGKGMWAAPDLMADMLDQKIGHPRAGANCAWVPSPTAATLHATHYHRVDVAARQAELAAAAAAGVARATRRAAARPARQPSGLDGEEIQREIDNNAQGILGYVVRWVDQGVGCSKVPDINDVGLMEDRATCRISSQHIANWLHHGVVTAPQVRETFERMARVVDAQNADDPAYEPMAPVVRRPGLQRRLRSRVRRARAAVRLHRTDPARPPPPAEGRPSRGLSAVVCR